MKGLCTGIATGMVFGSCLLFVARWVGFGLGSWTAASDTLNRDTWPTRLYFLGGSFSSARLDHNMPQRDF